jgi:hypothetical protein
MFAYIDGRQLLILMTGNINDWEPSCISGTWKVVLNPPFPSVYRLVDIPAPRFPMLNDSTRAKASKLAPCMVTVLPGGLCAGLSVMVAARTEWVVGISADEFSMDARISFPSDPVAASEGTVKEAVKPPVLLGYTVAILWN